jgi:two-component system, cell cycle response regulator DivK
MGQRHALIIDDNIPNLKILARLLFRQGVSCTEVPNPLELPDILRVLEHIDVVFLDLEMPVQDGYSVKELLRSYLGDTPIVACTVHVSEMNVARQAGFNGFLGKPLDDTRFPEQLERILRGESTWERG